MSTQLGGQPIYILKQGSSRNHGRDAQSMNITAAKAVANAVRTTLGPKGMDKMLVDSIGDVVITNDFPLADRCLKSGAECIRPNGTVLDENTIGSALAGRMVGEHLRSMGVETSGPPPFSNADRSKVLQALDAAAARAARKA